MKIGCIILARYNSRRLPGKALMKLDDKPLIRHVYDALRTVFRSEDLVVATSSESTDDPIAQYCLDHNIQCFRGDLTNVSQRFISAALDRSFTYAMRINGDNLFVELTSVARMVRDADPTTDFYSNVPGRTFPYGMSVEMVRTAFYLDLMEQIIKSERYQEHVTLYLYDHPEVGHRKYYHNDEYPEAEGIHLSIDTPEDARLAKLMIEELPKPIYRNQLSSIVQSYQLHRTE